MVAAKDEWILFARRSHPVVRDAIMDAAQRQGIAPKQAHDILTAQEASSSADMLPNTCHQSKWTFVSQSDLSS